MTIPLPKVIRQQVDVVPAQPGFNLVIPVHDHGKIVDLSREPILAWGLEIRTYQLHDGSQHSSSTMTPVTLGGHCDVDGFWAVEYPDGRCDVPYAEIFDTAGELLKFLQEEQDAPDAPTS